MRLLAPITAFALLTACHTEPYLVSRQALEEARRMTAERRASLTVPARAARDDAPVRIRFSALRLDKATLDEILARDFEVLRIRVNHGNPHVASGAVVLGMGLALGGFYLAALDDCRPGCLVESGLAVVGVMAGIEVLAGLIVLLVASLSPAVEPTW